MSTPEADPSLFEEAVTQVNKNTENHLFPLWMNNFAVNLSTARRGMSLDKIFCEPPTEKVLIVGRGPSLQANSHTKVLAENLDKFRGKIIASDGALPLLQEADVNPDYSLTVDGSPIISKWYQNKTLGSCRAVLPLTVHPSTFHACVYNKYKVYWYIPELDTENFKGSTHLLQLQTVCEENPTGLSRMNGAGCAGLCCIVFATTILRTKEIVLIGMDNGYRQDTPIEQLHYHDSILRSSGFNAEQTAKLYKIYYAPATEQYCVVDPVFEIYRRTFSALANQIIGSGVRLVNCSEGGCLYPEVLDVAKDERHIIEGLKASKLKDYLTDLPNR